MNNELQSIADFDKSRFKEKIIFILNHKNLNSSMVRVERNSGMSASGEAIQFPNYYGITSECQIFEGGKQRIIRYCLGEPSIYKDEQSDDTKVPKKKQTIAFNSGFLNVDKHEVLLLAFLRKHEDNGTNTGRKKKTKAIFFEYSATSGAKELIKNDMDATKVKDFCYKADWDEVRAYAMVLNIDIDRDPQEVRWELKCAGERDPKRFLAGLATDITKRKYTILQAIEDKILVRDMRQSKILWAGGNMICLAPMGKDPVDHLVDLTFNDERGEQLYGAIKDSLSPKIQGVPAEDEKKYGLQFPVDEMKKTIDEAVAAGVMKKSGVWTFYKDDKWNGRAVYKALSDNIDLKNEIEEATLKKKTPA